MADLGILVYCLFEKFLAPILVLAHTANHVQIGVEAPACGGSATHDLETGSPRLHPNLSEFAVNK